MSTREWVMFEAIMRLGSLTKAAQSLQISQSAVSQAVKHLEDRLRISLFDRGRGRLSPTAEAAMLYPHVRDLVDQVEGVEATARDLQHELKGSISLTCVPTLAVSILPGVISRFLERRPGVRVRLEVRNSAEAVALVSSGLIDLGVVHAIPANSEITIVSQAVSSMIGVVRRDHPVAKLKFLTPKLLDERSVITGRDALGSAVNAVFAKQGHVRRGLIEVNHSLTACALADENLGVALVDPFVNFEAFPRLVARPFRPHINLETYVIASSRRPPPVLGKVLCQLLAKSVRAPPAA